MSSDDYERLALEMLAVEAGDFADVKESMRKIIASAPDGADVAFLLSRALAHAGDRALTGERPEPIGPGARSARQRKGSLPWRRKRQGAPSRWWLTAAVPLLGAAALFWYLGVIALHPPDVGADAGMTAVSMFVISVGFLGAALIGVETLFLAHWQVRSLVGRASNLVRPPGWYIDPWNQATSRWWNGSCWTGGLRA